MPELTLYVLGPPVLKVYGIPLEVGRCKALILPVYLAVTEQDQSRDALATLFWPDYGQSQALHDLYRALGEELLETERETVGLRPRETKS